MYTLYLILGNVSVFAFFPLFGFIFQGFLLFIYCIMFVFLQFVTAESLCISLIL